MFTKEALENIPEMGSDPTPGLGPLTISEQGVLKQLSSLRGSLPKSGPLDFATKNSFPLFFVGEETLVGIY